MRHTWQGLASQDGCFSSQETLWQKNSGKEKPAKVDPWVGRTGEIGELRGLRKDPTQSPFIRLPTAGPLPSEGICLLALWLPLNWTTDSLSRRMDSAFSLWPTPQLTEKLQLQRKLFLSKVLQASVLSQWQKAN